MESGVYLEQSQPDHTPHTICYNKSQRNHCSSWGRWILPSPQDSDLTTLSWFCIKLNIGVASAVTAHTVPIDVIHAAVVFGSRISNWIKLQGCNHHHWNHYKLLKIFIAHIANTVLLLIYLFTPMYDHSIEFSRSYDVVLAICRQQEQEQSF